MNSSVSLGSSIQQTDTDYFEKVTNDERFFDYLKDIKRIIGDVQASIKKHRNNIDEKSLTELNAEISKSISTFRGGIEE